MQLPWNFFRSCALRRRLRAAMPTRSVQQSIFCERGKHDMNSGPGDGDTEDSERGRDANPQALTCARWQEVLRLRLIR